MPPVSDGSSVILLWMSGGPGHHETWDPKPEAVDQYRGPFGAIKTSVSGVLFSETLPESAQVMDKLAIVRSVRHGSGDHTKGNHWMLTGFEGPDFNKPDNQVQRRPSLGSAVAKLRGANVPGMPAYAAVPHLRGGTDNLFHYAAYLGGAANPFVVNSDPNSAKFRVRDLALAGDLTFDRLQDRQRLLATFDGCRRSLERPMQDLSGHYQAAFDMLTSPRVREAFDIDAEPASLRDAYGRHEFGQSASWHGGSSSAESPSSPSTRNRGTTTGLPTGSPPPKGPGGSCRRSTALWPLWCATSSAGVFMRRRSSWPWANSAVRRG